MWKWAREQIIKKTDQIGKQTTDRKERQTSKEGKRDTQMNKCKQIKDRQIKWMRQK